MIKKIFNLLKYPFIGPTRLGRVDYINLCSLLLIFTILLLVAAGLPLILASSENKHIEILIANIILLELFIFIFFIRLNNARLHDFNSSGWWNICAIIPIINLIFYLVLFTLSGLKGPNKYGNKATAPSLKKKVSTIFSLMIIWSINGFIAFMSLALEFKK